NNIHLDGRTKNAVIYFTNNEKLPVAAHHFFSVHSPPLDSINYWFLQKSVNLFGEAFVKTIAFEKTGYGSADSGISIIKEFWKERGIANPALKMIDGSGLSPANRVTTHALVTVMQYAKKQSWFASFYNALPLQNGIKMKSGYIGGVRSYTGYIRSRSGTEYTFSFIINNFDGSPGAVREKMWKLLDILK
ncbi:MAG: D-alanyl-D-alanine carboxypeptidase, partial [Ferruginibacter sp.]